MSPSTILSTVAILFATASATFTSPAPNTSWDVNSAHEIKWETAGLKEPLTMHLAPVGAIDISAYIATLAPSIPNSGSWSWQPTTSIPQHHKNVQIIIVDSGGHHQMSPPVQMVGWPQMLHTTIAAPVYTPPPVLVAPPMVHISMAPPVHSMAPPVHSMPPPVHSMPPPIHSMPPPVHTMAPVIETPVLVTSVEIIAPVHTSMEVVAPIQTSVEIIAPVHSIISAVESEIVVTSLWVAPIVHTSQPAPIIVTHMLPPIIQTEDVAPIIVTQTQEPVTKIVTQPALISTEYPAPIVKTVLVTETQAPIMHNISQPALTVVETMAPIIATETQAPIVKTIIQEPSIMTQNGEPILVTWQETKTHLLTSLVTVTPAHTIVVAPPATLVHTLPPVHTSAPMAVHSTLVVIHTPIGVVPSYSNTTTSAIPILSPSITTPLVPALMATTGGGSATTSGMGGLIPTFVSDAADVARGSVSWGVGMAALAMLFV